MFAEVIVDVPTRATDRPFTYQIPEALVSEVKLGMRVAVPFGVRHLEGFVINICRETDFSGEIKPLADLLDDEPVLLAEHLALGRWLSEHYYSFLINAYHTMLPRLLKAQYQKYFVPNMTIRVLNQQIYFKDAEAIPWEKAEEAGQLSDLLALKHQGEVTIHYEVADRGQPKTERWIKPVLPPESLLEAREALPKTAHKLRLLAEVLMELEGQAASAQALKQEFNLHLPTLRRAEGKEWLKIYQRPVRRDPFATIEVEATEPLTLLPEQAQAYESVAAAMEEQEDTVFLLEGVTGSGKTEVYLQLIEKALKAGRTALLLLPEISLTPQMLAHLRGRFGDEVAALHSQLSAGEQFDEWQRLRKGEAHIVVGARSSVFAPIEDIGIIIMDEEHETTYKQENDPRYHAREVAKWRAHYHQCPLLLGSATPSLESRARAQNGVYRYLQMTKRANQKPLPTSTVIDMREEFKQKNYHHFSNALYQAMQATLKRNEQVALLLNRRGYAHYVMCRSCGLVLKCPNCDVSLTYHYEERALKCHYCGFHAPLKSRCPQCHGPYLREFGSGVERVEQELLKLFPQERVIRLDNDSTRRKGSLEKLLAQVKNREANILLGTQMIAKGLDFEHITLVGILNADTSLYLPDFRAAERTFQLLTQVSGRAGRGALAGQVFIQTFNPDHYAIQCAQEQNYTKFYQQEMTYRHLNAYSPYYYTIRLTSSHEEENEALRLAMAIKKQLVEDLDTNKTILTGPSKSAISRVNNRYYFQMLCRYRDVREVRTAMKQLQERLPDYEETGGRVAIDVEPLSFM